jgi:hypothetical protein
LGIHGGQPAHDPSLRPSNARASWAVVHQSEKGSEREPVNAQTTDQHVFRRCTETSVG